MFRTWKSFSLDLEEEDFPSFTVGRPKPSVGSSDTSLSTYEMNKYPLFKICYSLQPFLLLARLTKEHFKFQPLVIKKEETLTFFRLGYYRLLSFSSVFLVYQDCKHC